MPIVEIDGERVDTRELINPPYTKCPKCKEQTFGVLHVGIDCYLRACIIHIPILEHRFRESSHRNKLLEGLT